MHNDEAVNAIKFGQLWENGSYRYDPNEHHGPSLYYATWVFNKLTGAPGFDHLPEARYRIVPALFGVGLVLLLPWIRDGLGRSGMLWAALFTAVSPALVFYSNNFIHESLLVFGTLLALAAGWRYWRTGRWVWAVMVGIGLGLMHGTKETFVLVLAAAAMALVFSFLWARCFDASGPARKSASLNFLHVAGAAGAWLLVAFLLFSSFLTNPQGLIDSVLTYLPWIQRAAGDSPHIHPWTFYFERVLYFHPPKSFLWTEGLILLLALVGAWAGFARQQLGDANAVFVRFLALYSFLLAAIYSFISYKTPWCLFGFWHGFVLLAGVGAAVLTQGLKPVGARVAVSLLLISGAGHLAWQSWQAVTEFAADRRNPHVYAQTSPHLIQLVERVEALARVHPDGYQMLLKVVSPDSDYWPLPWYLRRFQRVGWWDEAPADPYAPIMIVSSKLDAALDARKTHLMVGYYQLRPEVFLELYVELGLWRTFLERNPPPIDRE